MDRNIEQEMKSTRILAVAIITTAILFGLIGLLLFIQKDSWELFPRMDIAWIGFILDGTLLCVMGIFLLLPTTKKQTWIEETDERKTLLAAHSCMVGYAVQTFLLGITTFLLIFMGYLNRVAGFSIIGIIIVSNVISSLYGRYLEKTN